MASNRRMGPENAATRSALMDATEAVMRDEGYAAVSSRRVAERAGVNQQTVYYYFQTMDDLLLAAFRRRTRSVLQKLEKAMAAERPLHAFWRTLGDPFDAALTMEYLALANHNEPIRLETIEFGERLRRLQVEGLRERIDLPSEELTPLAIVMAITYIGHLLGFEATLGIRGGHKDIRVLMEWCLRKLEPISGRESGRVTAPAEAR
jgi:AcrR family transcriptional regulator